MLFIITNLVSKAHVRLPVSEYTNLHPILNRPFTRYTESVKSVQSTGVWQTNRSTDRQSRSECSVVNVHTSCAATSTPSGTIGLTACEIISSFNSPWRLHFSRRTHQLHSYNTLQTGNGPNMRRLSSKWLSPLSFILSVYAVLAVILVTSSLVGL